MQTRLRDYLEGKVTDWQGCRITTWEPIQEGWESEIYAFRLEYGEAANPRTLDLILRMFPSLGDAAAKAANEFRAITMMEKSGYPVPKPYLLEPSSEPLGKPFIIIERIPGKVMWSLMAEVQTPSERDALVDLFGSLMARLHQLEWRVVVPNPEEYEPGTPTGVVDRLLRRFREWHSRNPLEGFSAVLDWLEDHKQAAAHAKAVVIHQDFHPMNIIVPPLDRKQPEAYPQGIVIDWTGIDITDARVDLGWTLMLAHAYLPGLREILLNAYERHIGAKVANLDYFDVVACFRRLYSIAVSLSSGAGSSGMRPGAENIMRSQQEPIHRVMDLLYDRTGLRIAAMAKILDNNG